MEPMQVLTAQEMQACDRRTTERFGVPSVELMRTASRAVAAFAREQFSRARRVTVLAGGGNNGGDGLMASRLLAEAGLEVTTLLFSDPAKLTGDAATAWSELTAQSVGPIHVVAAAEQLAPLNAVLETDLVLDALLGTGFAPPLRGLAAAALAWFLAHPKQEKIPVLAVDLPSGWPADASSLSAPGPCFPADAVITFTAPKPAHVFGALTRRWDQPVVVAPIGSPDEAILAESNLRWAGAAHALVEPLRPVASNKGNFGHVLVVGGSVGKSGAPAMTALAALRAGAGLVTAAVPEPILDLVAAIAPELMPHPLAVSADGQIAYDNLSSASLEVLVKGKTVLALGPGLGQSPEAAEFALNLLSATRMPAVLDADALNILAARRYLLTSMAKARPLVLTPHPGEMARLAGLTIAQVQADRLGVARGFAQHHGCTLVLKGARTLIAHPDGAVAVNTSGNPAQAKGGSGDTLTGIVAALIAQHPDRLAEAVEAAVYLHGLAADFALRRRDQDQHTLVATDSLRSLSRAFRFRPRGPSGYLWMGGLPANRRPYPREATE
jgi:NAD(P)H-hydrate epimerase